MGEGGGDFVEMGPQTTGAAISGHRPDGSGVGVEQIDPDGFTEVIVIGGERWYRIPWLIEYFEDYLDDTEWIRVSGDEPIRGLNLASTVVVERFDVAVRELLDAVDSGRLAVPTDRSELAEQLGTMVLVDPWLAAADGLHQEAWGNATAKKGSAKWSTSFSGESDGPPGRAGGAVTWAQSTVDRPEEPGRSIHALTLAKRALKDR